MELVNNQHVLIEQAKRGNETAFRSLFDAYQYPVYHFIYRMLGDVEEAKDISQDVFFKVHKKLGSLRDPRFFSTWLFSIAKNEAITASRRKRKRQSSSIDEFTDGQEAGTFADLLIENPELTYIENEFEEIIQKILNEIPEIYRSAFILGVLQKYPYEEVAKILGCSIGNIKSRVFRARIQILQKLKKYSYDPVDEK